ncbi:MAG: hypothetical protein KAJ32_02245 [Gammaproteobacteria bacterium]|nr:hypothetical protein [Gammaproteobacteria bacterium]
MTEKMWKVKEGVKLDDETAEEVAKIACALKSLAIYTALACENEDNPKELQEVVDAGVDAMNRLFDH